LKSSEVLIAVPVPGTASALAKSSRKIAVFCLTDIWREKPFEINEKLLL
jgi:hypothetical protein